MNTFKKVALTAVISGALATASCTAAAPQKTTATLDPTVVKTLHVATSCSVYSALSGRVELSKKANSAISKYPDEYFIIVSYFYGKSEGYVLGAADIFADQDKSVTKEEAIVTAAKVLFKLNKCASKLSNLES
jgi:hypothetical protein